MDSGITNAMMVAMAVVMVFAIVMVAEWETVARENRLRKPPVDFESVKQRLENDRMPAKFADLTDVTAKLQIFQAECVLGYVL